MSYFSLRHAILGINIIPLLNYIVIIFIMGLGANSEHDLMKIIGLVQ